VICDIQKTHLYGLPVRRKNHSCMFVNITYGICILMCSVPDDIMFPGNKGFVGNDDVVITATLGFTHFPLPSANWP